MKTKRYLLKIRLRTALGTFRLHQLACYGLESITEVSKAVSPERLQKVFPDIPLVEINKIKGNRVLSAKQAFSLVS